jgi:transposase
MAVEQGKIDWRFGAVDGSFSPGKGGGEKVAHGYKGKGVIIHTLTDANGMPLANRTTAANGNERAQVIPLLDAVKPQTGMPGRPRKRPDVIAADKGYDSKELREAIRRRGIRPQLPKRVFPSKPTRGRPILIEVPRFQMERTFAWLQRKYRRLVVRWERLPQIFDAFLSLATIHFWLSKLIVE